MGYYVLHAMIYNILRGIKLKIVFCDDNATILNQVKECVAEFFATVGGAQPEYAAYTCGEALLTTEDRIDIAFLDVEMPGISGIDVGSKLKDRNPHIKIIILTAHPEYLDDAMDLRVFRYLSKPIDKDRLFRNLRDAVREYNMESAEQIIETPTATLYRRTDEIICVETKGRKTTVYTLDGIWESTRNMEYWQSVLVQPCFFVTNRSYIVNMTYVSSFDRESILLKYGDNELVAYLTKRKYTDFKDRQLLFWGGAKAWE